MKTSRYFSDNIIIFCAVSVLLSFIGQIFKINSVVNLIYTFTLLLVFVCYFLNGHISKIMLILFALTGIACIANGIVLNNIDYYSHVLIIICTYICIEVGVTIKIRMETYRIISFLFLLTSMLLVVFYYFGPLKTSYFKWTDAICLNFPNPNAAALWLACIFTLLFYSSFLFSGVKKALYLLISFSIFPIIIATQSRNSYLACILLIAGTLVAKIFNIKRVPNFVWAILACLPIIVFVFYMFVIVKNLDFWQDLFAIDSINKGLGTRQGIWQNVLDDFLSCFLFGNYPKYYDSQMHNSLLTIFCRFGIFATTAVCVLLYRALKTLQDKSSFYAALSLAAILFTGCFEASVFIGIAGLYLMLLIIPSCASIESE